MRIGVKGHAHARGALRRTGVTGFVLRSALREAEAVIEESECIVRIVLSLD